MAKYRVYDNQETNQEGKGLVMKKDRLMLVGGILLDVDEISIVERVDAYYPDSEYGTFAPAGLQVTMRDRQHRRIETDMSVVEFQAKRAEYFVEESEEKDKLEGVDYGESDWTIEDFSTLWSFYHAGSDQWVGVENMTVAIDESKKYGTKHRAIVYRTLSKEWDVND